MQFQPSQFSYGAGEVTFTSKTGEVHTVRSQEDVQRIMAEVRAAEAERQANLPTAEDQKKAAVALSMGAGLIALSVAGTFVLWPMAIKQFKPDWPYSKRLVGGFFASAVLNALYRVGREEKD